MMQPTVSSPTPACAHVEAGAPSAWRRFQYVHPALGKVAGKLFLKEPLGLTGMEMSLSVIPPGAGIPFLHRHRRNEEVYVFLQGRGEFQVDGAVFGVAEGSVVRVAPSGARAYRNTGEEPLAFIVIQAVAGTDAGSTIEDGEPVAGEVTWPA